MPLRSMVSRKAPVHTKMTEAQRISSVAESCDVWYINNETKQTMKDKIEEYGNVALGDIGIDTSFNMLNPRVLTHLHNYSSKRIVRINNTTKKRIREQLTIGVSEGEGNAKLTRRIKDVFKTADRTRARTIARTEVTTSSNFATFEAGKQSGVIEKKQWAAALVNSREWHEDANGQVRNLDEPFDVRGERGMYPGDQGGFTGMNVVNCMCVMKLLVDKPKSVGRLDYEWKLSFRQTLPWRTLLREGFRRAFRRQKDDVLRELGIRFPE